MALVNKGIVVYLKHVVEHNVAIDLPNYIVFDQHQPIYFNVQCEALSVETSADLFVDFYEDVIGWFLYGSLRVFLRYGVHQLELLEWDLRDQVVKRA